MDTRIESLMKSLERNHHRFQEIFIDEDTGEEYALRYSFENLNVKMI